MTRDEIMLMAEHAGLCCDGTPDSWDTAAIERFAALVAEAEREACALTCENETVKDIGPGDEAYNSAVQHCAYAIRERGEKP